MEIASNPRMVVIAMVGLCAVIGVMSLLAVVYYTNAANVQSQTDAEIAALTAERNDLEQQVESRDSQISALEAQVSSLNSQVSSLNAQISSLNSQMESLNVEKTSLTGQVADLTRQNSNLKLYVDGLKDLVNTLDSELTPYETYPIASGRGMGVHAHAT